MYTTLKKILDELDKDEPRIEYIRGMVEVLVDQEPTKTPTDNSKIGLPYAVPPFIPKIHAGENIGGIVPVLDEGVMLDNMAASALAYGLPPLVME